MEQIFCGFEPFWDKNSKILVLGSFPSVKSREQGFFYGNKQNRFWSTLGKIFCCQIEYDVESKRKFLADNGVALWDVVYKCRIKGSSDDSIKAEQIADVSGLLKKSNIQAVFCNGTKSFELYRKYFPDCLAATKLPSTSPANARFDQNEWIKALKPYATNGVKR